MAGIQVNDRELGARIRRLTLRQIERIMMGDDEGYKKEIIMKLAPSILPRLHEHTGDNGGSLRIEISKEIAEKNNLYASNPGAGTDSK